MSLVNEILTFNKVFVDEKEYVKFETNKIPDKRVVVLTCMDTRLIDLLHSAMDIGHGDMKIVKNAGAVVSHPFGSIMRSILVAIYELGAEEVMVIGHHDCGMSNIKADTIIDKAITRGVSQEKLELLDYAGVSMKRWLKGFESVEESVKHSVGVIRMHPLLPSDIPVHGMVIDPGTGKLDLVDEGYNLVQS